MKVITIIPAYNEGKRSKVFSSVIRRAKKYSNLVIVVNDGSTDNTEEIAKKARAKVISYKNNRGNGYAKRLGSKIAMKYKPDIIIFLDADGQHRPEDIPKFLKALKKSDMVIGSRFKGKIATSRINLFGNIGLRFGVNLLCFGFNFNKWLSDTECGYRAIKADKLKKLNLKADRYAIEAEMILEASRKKLKINEISIVSPRKVKGVGVLDGFKNAWHLFVRWLFG